VAFIYIYLLILQITMLLFVKGEDLYWQIYFSNGSVILFGNFFDNETGLLQNAA